MRREEEVDVPMGPFEITERAGVGGIENIIEIGMGGIDGLGLAAGQESQRQVRVARDRGCLASRWRKCTKDREKEGSRNLVLSFPSFYAVILAIARIGLWFFSR